MTDRERQRAATVEAIVGAVMLVGGLLLVRLSGLLFLLGEVLAAFGLVAVILAVALGLGQVSRSPVNDRDGRR